MGRSNYESDRSHSPNEDPVAWIEDPANLRIGLLNARRAPRSERPSQAVYFPYCLINVVRCMRSRSCQKKAV